MIRDQRKGMIVKNIWHTWRQTNFEESISYRNISSQKFSQILYEFHFWMASRNVNLAKESLKNRLDFFQNLLPWWWYLGDSTLANDQYYFHSLPFIRFSFHFFFLSLIMRKTYSCFHVKSMKNNFSFNSLYRQVIKAL